MEPPHFAAISVFILSILDLSLTAAYEATFTVLSRSSLEKLDENGVTRTRPMLRIYEPRHRLRLMARLGEALGIIGLSLSLFFITRFIFRSYQLPEQYSILVATLGTLCIFLLVSTPRRIRFEEEGEEPRIPTLALAFVPLHTLLLPFTNFLDHFTSGDYTDEDFRAEKEEELRSFVESESETGVLEEGENEMIQGVFGFHDRIAREVMVPRVDVVGIEQSSPLADMLQLIDETGHSRLPVYKETLDHICGLIYAKDLLRLLVGREGLSLSTPLLNFLELEESHGDRTVSFIRVPYYVPETKKIDELLHDLRANKTRLAVVVDEYGGTAGLVTTEDLIEEIVGEIQDEYDDEEALFHWVEPKDLLIVNARIDIDDLNEMLETDLPNEGFETLGGFIYDHLGRIPDEGQSFQVGNLEIKILKVEGQRIAQVQIKCLRLPDEQEGN